MKKFVVRYGFLRLKICRSSSHFSVNHFTFTAFYSADKFSKEQQILGLFCVKATDARSAIIFHLGGKKPFILQKSIALP